MNLTPIKKPTFALSISEDALYLVEAKKSWGATRLRQIRQVPLPAGVVRLSSAKLNIEHEETFVEQLRILVEPLKKPLSIAVSLPDLCARTNVFDFSTFPSKKAEQTALLTWRFQQDLKLDTAQSRLSYSTYASESRVETSKDNSSKHVRVLGTALRNEIVEQYERVCLDVNLMPISISISGLDIFDLYHDTIQQALKAHNRGSLKFATEGMFLFISHWGFTFLAFNEGCPNFIRTKAMSIRPDPKGALEFMTLSGLEQQATPSQHSAETGQTATEQHSQTGENQTIPYPPYTAKKAEKEILATLQYYFETFQQDASLISTTNLFVVSDLEHGHLLLPAFEDMEQTAKVSGLNASPIHVTHLAYPKHLAKKKRRVSQESTIWSALPGYASLQVA